MIRNASPTLALLFLLAGCSDTSPDRADAPAESAEARAPADPVDPAPRDYKAITLLAFSCGDNCYLTFTRGAEAREESAMCTARECGEWQQRGALPANLVGASAEGRFGVADQRDAEGTVMNDDVVTILALRDIRPAKAGAGLGPLPLQPGVFVLEGSACANPSSPSFRIWNGDGLSGSSTRNCRAGATSTGGSNWRVENDCENTYDGSRSSETLTLAVTAPTRFAIGDQAFRRCADGSPPAEMEEIARTRSTAR